MLQPINNIVPLEKLRQRYRDLARDATDFQQQNRYFILAIACRRRLQGVSKGEPDWVTASIEAELG